MTKYSFIVLSSDLDVFLKELQKLGMVDITRSKKAIDGPSRDMINLSARYRNALNKLNKIPKEFPDVKPIELDIPEEALLQTIEHTYSLREELIAKQSVLRREHQDAVVWGEFSNEDITRLNNIGFEPHFYSVTEKKFKESWKEEYALQELTNYKGRVYFTILHPLNEGEFKFELQDAKFPEKSSTELGEEIKKVSHHISTITQEIVGFASKTDILSNLQSNNSASLDLHLASAASVKEGEDSISVLEGFAPTEQDKVISQYLDSTDAYYISQKAVVEDNPPIKLKNNLFAQLFEPIGSLYELPKYNEPDLTPYFAPFYMLFFGLCLGDMGYGLVLIIFGLIASIAVPKMAKYGKLVVLLGLGSVIMPLLSGTFFGMKLYDIFPSMPESIKELFFTDMNMFWFAIIFGIFQLIFAKMLHAIDCISHKRWDPALTNIGWCLIMVWCTLAYAGSMTGKVMMPPTLGYIIAGIGLVLVLFCSKPSKKFYLRPLKGIISLYDITGIFGDILSYIRLFGLGITGGILALVINSIAMQFTNIPYIGWLFTIIMLIIGHLAVLGLSCLGAFVHPVRLTFVEFYKNSSFQGGGREFNPLKINK